MELIRELESRLIALAEQGQWEAAKILLEAYLKLTGPEGYTERTAVVSASVCLGLGRYEEALAHARSGLYRDTGNYELYYLMGEAFAGLGREERACLCYENAVFMCGGGEDRAFLLEAYSRYVSGCVHRPPKTAIVILSYNGMQETIDCLKSIRAYTPRSAREIIVVDNHSTDGSAEWLKEQPDILLICNEENRGFPGGCNQGIKAADPEADIFLLNNDTLLMRNSLFNLRMALYERGTVGAAGAVSNSAHYFQEIAAEYDTVEDYYGHAAKWNAPDDNRHERRIRLIGFAMLLKRKALEKTGLLDERFTPGNGEDDDISLRLWQAGYENILCMDSFIFHWGGKSFLKDRRRYQELIGRNRKKLHEKYGCPVTEYSYIHFDALKEIRREREEEFTVLAVGCGLGADLLRLFYDYPNVRAQGLEENQNAVSLASAWCSVTKGGVEKAGELCPPGGFDYIIQICRDDAGSIDEREEEQKLRSYLKGGGRLIIVKERSS